MRATIHGRVAQYSATSARIAAPPVASLIRAGLSVPISVVALIALNVAQNGPERPASLEAVMAPDDVPLTFDGPPTFKGDGGILTSGIFTPTDTAPDSLESLLTLRTKADMVRAWRNGKAPDLPGQNGPEAMDGAVLRRGVLSPCTSFITHKLFGAGQRWRGKVFDGEAGTNRFGGSAKNRFGVTSSDAREIERLIREQVRYQKAQVDPLMRRMIEGADGFSLEEGAKRAADKRAAAIIASERAAASTGPANPEVSCRPFTARLDMSRLDGRPALILEYSQGESLADFFWGRVLGMRDELREVVPGVLVGLGSFGMFGGVRNCAPFVLVRAEATAS